MGRTDTQAAVAVAIGRRIRDLRVASKLSQEKLARRANVATATVYRAETGRNIPDWETLERIAEALNAELADLLQAVAGLESSAANGYFPLDPSYLPVPSSDVPSPRRNRRPATELARTA